MNNPHTPYANLDPSLILHAVESAGFSCTGSLLALNSYENRVYQLGIEAEESFIIAKFYRPQRWSDAAILEEHQFAAELVAHDIPVVPPLCLASGQTLAEYAGYRFALFPRQGGRTLELDNLEQLEWMGRFIGRLHAVGRCRPFQQRLNLDVHTYGHQPYQFLLEHNFIPAELRQSYCATVEGLLQAIAQCFLQTGKLDYIRLHGDCHAGNLLWNTQGPRIVDLDDCIMGPAVQDLWMLMAGGTQAETEAQLDHLLRGYTEFCEFNFRELQLIEALRALRMLHYSAWLAKRWQDPAFPLNFPWFNTLRYWQEQQQNLAEQRLLLENRLENSFYYDD